ncbi:LysR family transcriptional regulator [Ferrimonas sp.]|uniref:LysR family transcriptional regulator n=1 Tax=Ferrimonas sp. TaxID=2080861 RepID=UPI003A9485E3
MKIDDLELFNTVVEYGSQSEAARVLGIPPSKISRRLAIIEQQLNTKLFERTAKGFELTEAGEQVLQSCKRVLAEMEELKLGVGKLQRNPEGAIVVAAPLDFINRVCRPAMKQFHEQFPGLQLKFISYQSRQNPMEVQADLVLFVGHDTPPDCAMVAQKLAVIRREFMASPAWIADHPELVHPRQLVHYPCLLSAKGAQPPTRWLWSEGGRVHSIDVDGPLDSEINELCISAAVDGLGVAWVAPCMCEDELNSGDLQILFDGKYGTPITTWGLYSNRHYMPQRVRIVLEFFKDGMKDIG